MKFNISRTSWKTASTGILSIVFTLLGYIDLWINLGHYPGQLATMTALTTIFTGIGLLVARDNDKTSKEVGATLFEKQRDIEEQNQNLTEEK